MLSNYLIKQVNQLNIDKVTLGNSHAFISFKGTESNVSIHYDTGKVMCTCHNGSLVGVNHKQLCKHKIKFVKELMEVVQ